MLTVLDERGNGYEQRFTNGLPTVLDERGNGYEGFL